jgi:SAM-dependent methyltransferase
MHEPFTYPGGELALFQQAYRWKKYFSGQLSPFIRGKVLEVGAGMGGTTSFLYNTNCTKWKLLEPDHSMAETLRKKIASGELPAACVVKEGTIDLEQDAYDTILYIDVLEHIREDAYEMIKASRLLDPGGHLVVLAPAHPFLFSAFDQAIGHYRRYTKKMLKKITPAGMPIVYSRYIDSAGYFASCMNKLILHQKYPSVKQVRTWDRWMIPVSKLTDKIFLHVFGRSIITVWRK